MKKSKFEKNNWYNNIKGVKKAGIRVPLLPEQVQEIIKCSQDPIYFIENYVYIDNKDLGKVLFKLRNYQKKIIRCYQNNRFSLIKIGRQSGKTITSSAYFLWLALFNDKYEILMLANKEKVAVEAIDRIKFMIQFLPLWLQEGITKWNETSIRFENNSKIEAQATTKSSGRGGTWNIVYVDEIAHIERNTINPFMESSFPSITSAETTKFIATSTPQGLNMFWKMCCEAKVDFNNKPVEEGTQGKNEFVLLEFDWNVDGIHDEDFKSKIIAKFGIQYWHQEYECRFLGSAGTFLSSEILSKLVAKNPINIETIYKENHELKIFEEPINEHNYIVTYDPSEGSGLDYAGIHVWDLTDKLIRKQVAVMYDDRLDFNEAPFVVAQICRKYNNALLLPENNKCADIIAMILEKADYDNIFWYNGKLGIYMTESSRNRGLVFMEKEFRKERFEINDVDTIHELSVFIKKDGKYQADDGQHDDLVMSLVLLCWFMSDENRYKEFILDKIQYRKEIHGLPILDEFIPVIIDNGINRNLRVFEDIPNQNFTNTTILPF